MSNHDALIQSLIDGNQRFIADQSQATHRDQARRDELTKGQSPKIIVLSCADSRVAPELLFDVGLGDLFVCRVAGNIANTSTIASIEYAVANLGSELIVVLGHESCGAVGAALSGGDNGYNLNHLLSHLNAAACSEHGGDVNTAVKTNAKNAAAELEARSAIIAGAVKSGKLKIAPGYYAISGKVDFLN